MAFCLLILSLALQAIAVVLALRLIPVSGARFPWLLISAALTARLFREGVTLWLAVAQGSRLNSIEEGISLAVSAFLLLGTNRIKPLFIQLKQALAEREDLLEKSRQARRRSEEERLRLRTTIDHLPVGVSILDADGGIVEVNEAIQPNLGRENASCPQCFRLWGVQRMAGNRRAYPGSGVGCGAGD